MVNLELTTLLGWSRGDVQRRQKMSRDTSRDDILGSWRSKKFRFWRNPEDVFKQLNSVSWVELGEVTCRGHVSYQA